MDEHTTRVALNLRCNDAFSGMRYRYAIPIYFVGFIIAMFWTVIPMYYHFFNQEEYARYLKTNLTLISMGGKLLTMILYMFAYFRWKLALNYDRGFWLNLGLIITMAPVIWVGYLACYPYLVYRQETERKMRVVRDVMLS